MKTTTFKILYEDDDILVCVKPHGLPTQSKNTAVPDLETLLLTHIAANSSARPPYLAVIHRLDQPVAGLLVFAKTPFAASKLNKQLQTDGFGKYYKARVSQTPAVSQGTLTDYLVKDGRTNTSHICPKNTPGAKLAKLSYRTLEPDLLEIHLDTGRHHQIRVQLAHMGCPIVGDTKYNPDTQNQKGWQELKLWAFCLSFSHPRTGKELHFEWEDD